MEPPQEIEDGYIVYYFVWTISVAATWLFLITLFGLHNSHSPSDHALNKTAFVNYTIL